MNELSTNAQKLLERLKAGRWYEAYAKDTPKAMKELEDAGLVTATGRVIEVRLCYVPAEGYVPYEPEKFIK